MLIRATAGEGPAPSETDDFEREFEILQTIDGHGVPRPLELLRAGGRRALVFADPGGAPLASAPRARRGETAWCLDAVVAVLEAVSSLHQQAVVHGRLTPWTMLVDARATASFVDFSHSGTSAMPPPPMSLAASVRTVLPYVAPEQTGRMNRAIDHRADLYAVGIVLYELLTGVVPFASDDPLELVHWHVARPPAAPSELDPLVGEALTAILTRLLAKTADDRYQSAGGVIADLRACREALDGAVPLRGFAPGLCDLSDRFMVSGKLYGREGELHTLADALDRAVGGSSSAVFIGGPSGIGKTALVQELYRPLVQSRGYFTSGKFDQVARHIPFGGLIDAFSGVLRQLLAEPEDRLAQWRIRLSTALGVGASVLAAVIPEVEWLVGPQPAAPALDGAAALNRFQMVFVRFVGALAGSGHPLVVFLDDLQWADAATLNLLTPLLSSPDVNHVLLIGAYRDGEVGSAHLLREAISQLESVSVLTSRLALNALSVDDVTALLADTIHLEADDVRSLARVVHGATAGSPFFVVQYLYGLHRDGLIWFDRVSSRWRFALEAIADAATTDDVVALMTQRIRRLAPRAQVALTRAALLGGRFDVATLAAACAASTVDTQADVRLAVAEGLLLSSDHTYRFLHDRVQQAALELEPATDQPSTHLSIGRRLREHWGLDAEPERIFDLVGHFNAARTVLDSHERFDVALLNQDAGRRAKGSTAWEPAAEYFEMGADILGAGGWDAQPDLMFALHLDAAECRFLAGQFDRVDVHVDRCLAEARSAMDAAQVHALCMVVHENRSQYEQAVASGRRALALLGIDLVDDGAAPAALEREIDTIERLRAGRPIAALLDLPPMSDAPTQLAMRVLTALWSSSYISGRQVGARLISATLVRLSMTLGNTPDSAYGYVTHAITIGPDRGEFEAAYEWGRLALAVNARFDDRRLRAKINQQFHAHVCLWRRPFAECVAYAREATRSGLEGGDLIYAGYGAVTETWAALPSANSLDQFVRDYEPSVALVERLRLDDFGASLRLMLGWALALQGRTANPTSLGHDGFDEAAYAKRFAGEVFFRTFYYTAKLQLAVLMGDVGAGLTAVRELGDSSVPGTIWPVLADFWGGLALTAAFPSMAPAEQPDVWARLARARDSLGVLAANAPENYRGFWLMLSAEMARVSLRFSEAQDVAATAIAHAVQIGNIQQEALANELMARAVTQLRGADAARPFILEAVRCYEAWGARAKADRLRVTHRVVDTSARPQGGDASSRPDLASSFDMAAVLKIAQAVAVEIRLADLLPKLIRIAIQHAGAQRGLFVQETKGRLVIEAEGFVGSDHVRVLESLPIEDGTRLATSVVQYVRHTARSVVVADALGDERFASDPYVQAARPRSILAVPVVHEGRVTGILYLEHALAADVFTPARVSLMQLVSAQAAVGLENANLYREVLDEASQRRRAEEVLREVTEGTASTLGEGFFRSLVQHLASALRVQYAFITECRESRTKARSLAFWSGDQIADNFEYDVADTPCRLVFEGRVCFYPRDVQSAFPKDLDLASLSAESYLGAPMVDAAGQVIGHIAVLDKRPMDDDARASAVLSIFSARAGAELERHRAEQQLRAALSEVEALKNRLQEENVYLRDEIQGEHNFEDMVGRSQALTDVLRTVERVAATDAAVLILGETGTGKELIARAVHSRSTRRHRPLVKVNCGAIASGLVESELFGHVKGAFTGAIDKRVGRFELADGGTVFLDEVGELPLDAQVKLLRVLQEREFEPVGSSKTVHVDVRIIAATNRNLTRAIEEGRFRADLYFRLNVISVNVPSLRERQDDIPLLVNFFVTKFARRFGRAIEAVSQETMRRLSHYAWPGNVRELQNVIERAVVPTDGPVLSLGPDLLPSARTPLARPIPLDGAEVGGDTSLEETERRHISSVLERAKYVIEGPAGAALLLGLHPNTLRSRMKKLGISRPPGKPNHDA